MGQGRRRRAGLSRRFLRGGVGLGRLCSCIVPACLRLRWLPLYRCDRWSGFGGVVEADDAEGVAGPGGVGEAGGFEELEHAGWAGEAFDRGGEVGVGAALAGDEAAYAGEDGFEVE